MPRLVKVRLLVSFGGPIAGYDSPSAGTVLEVEPETYGVALYRQVLVDRLQKNVETPGGQKEEEG